MKLDWSDFKNKLNIIHNNKYDYSLIEYNTTVTKVKIICPVHGIFEQTLHNHKRYGCKKCSFEKKRITQEEFIKKSKIKHENKYDYSFVVYVTMHSKVKINCEKHGEFSQTPANHLAGKGCPMCCCNYKKGTEYFLKKCNKIHNNKYQYFNLSFIKNTDKIKIMCPIHGEFEQIVNNHLQGHGCPVCNESRGEVKILKFLTENNINFIRQKKFKECKNIKLLSFDFYLPEYNMCIEFDGEQHFRTVNEWGGENSYVNIKKNDDIKNDFCDKNSIELIRINYKENINDILKNKIKI